MQVHEEKRLRHQKADKEMQISNTSKEYIYFNTCWCLQHIPQKWDNLQLIPIKTNNNPAATSRIVNSQKKQIQSFYNWPKNRDKIKNKGLQW